MSIHETPGQPAASASSNHPSPFPNLRQRRRRTLRLTTAATMALGLAVSGGAVAGAATPGTAPSASAGAPGALGAPGAAPTGGTWSGGTPPVAMGTVATVGTDTFTLTTRNGTVTVDVGSTTSYLDRGVSSPSFADVVVGAHVAVFGTESSDTVTAAKVAVGGPNGPGGTPPAGTRGDLGPNGGTGRPPAPTTGSNSGSTWGTTAVS